MKEYKFSRLVFQSLLSGSFYTNERSQKSKYLDEKEAEFPDQVVKVIEKDVSHPTSPITIRDIKSKVHQEWGLNYSDWKITKIIKKRSNYSYK